MDLFDERKRHENKRIPYAALEGPASFLTQMGDVSSDGAVASLWKTVSCY